MIWLLTLNSKTILQGKVKELQQESEEGGLDTMIFYFVQDNSSHERSELKVFYLIIILNLLNILLDPISLRF
jgi:hypothetical protein